MRAPLTLGIVASLALALLLSGCGGQPTPAPTAPTTPSVSPAPKPSASAPANQKNVLFTIAANVRGKDGGTIAIQLTAHKPVLYSSSDAKPLITEFVKSCGTGIGGVPVTAESLATNGSILVSMDLRSSVIDKPFVYPIDLRLGSPYFGQSATGTGIAPTDTTLPCYDGYTWSKSGSGHAVADFETGNPGPDPTIWKYAYYGFTLAPDSNATIEACKVTLTPFATTTVAGVEGWDPTQAANGIACGIGYAGE